MNIEAYSVMFLLSDLAITQASANLLISYNFYFYQHIIHISYQSVISFKNKLKKNIQTYFNHIYSFPANYYYILYFINLLIQKGLYTDYAMVYYYFN